MCNRCFLTLLRFEEISLHCGNKGIAFINFEELCAAFFQMSVELWVPNLNQNGTHPFKIRLTQPPEV